MGIRELKPTYEIEEMLTRIEASNDEEELELLRNLIIEESTEYTLQEWFIIDNKILSKKESL